MRAEFSYFLAFEYSLIARNYAIGILLVFILCALLARENRKPLPIALTLFLLCHTSAHGTIIAIAFSISLFAERIYASTSARTFLALRPSQAVAAAVVLLGIISALIQIGIISAVIQMIPRPVSGYSMELHLVPEKWRTARLVFSALFEGYLPVPNSEHALLEHSSAEKGLVGPSDCTRTWRLTTRVCLFGPQEPSGTYILYRCHRRSSLLLQHHIFRIYETSRLPFHNTCRCPLAWAGQPFK